MDFMVSLNRNRWLEQVERYIAMRRSKNGGSTVMAILCFVCAPEFLGAF
jgi:hypothetical protein